MMAFCPEHPKWDQNPKFTPLSETTSIPTPFISGVPPPPWRVSFGKTRAIKNEPHSLVTDSSSFSLSPCSPFSEQAIKMSVRWKSNKLSENLSLVPGCTVEISRRRHGLIVRVFAPRYSAFLGAWYFTWYRLHREQQIEKKSKKNLKEHFYGPWDFVRISVNQAQVINKYGCSVSKSITRMPFFLLFFPGSTQRQRIVYKNFLKRSVQNTQTLALIIWMFYSTITILSVKPFFILPRLQ